MRTLCLILPKQKNPTYAEQYLRFSPRINARNREERSLLFIDIQSTTGFFGGEANLLAEVKDLALQTSAGVSLAIADHPWVAQALAEEFGEYIGEPGNDSGELADLPLRVLPHLEGVLPWSAREVQIIATFFELLGFKFIRDLKHLSIESFRERWGKTGGWLWKKLHLQDSQVISPIEPTDSLVEYMHLDDPTYMLSFLLYCLELSLKNLCLRLQGRGECAHKIYLNLYCEYSQEQHRLEFHPTQPTRQMDVILKLFEHRLSQMSFENPIRHFDVEIIPAPENIQQLDFFEPRERDSDKLLSLSSLLKQADVPAGFFRLENHLWPEESWSIVDEPVDFVPIEDVIEVDGESFQIKPAYSQSVLNSPRPTKMLEQPRPMSDGEIKKLKFLTPHPVEKLEDGWWEISRGRDYYWAVSGRGQNLWIFHDHVEQKYYLHGYLD